jgi:hypothetical protein
MRLTRHLSDFFVYVRLFCCLYRCSKSPMRKSAAASSLTERLNTYKEDRQDKADMLFVKLLTHRQRTEQERNSIANDNV